jgi:ribose transport system ATP-binding protein
VPEAALSLRNIRKTYPGVIALDDVTFEVVHGEIHALVGENGAGKSTLMAVASGATRPDSGRVAIGGRELTDAKPSSAQEAGLAVVYQHPALLLDLTVVENLMLAMPEPLLPRFSAAVPWAVEVLAAVDCDVDPRERVSELSVAQRHLVEIAKALAMNASVLVLDEPTEPLTDVEIDMLLGKLAKLRDAGRAIVYISHRIPEVKRIADRLTVLRDGAVRGTFTAADVSEDEIVSLIVGRSIESTFPAKRHENGTQPPPVLEVTGFTAAGLDAISLTASRGEIIGLAGVEGNGQKEFIRALAGLGRDVSGEVRIDGQKRSLRSPVQARAAGVSYTPGDRRNEGLFMALPVRENATVLALNQTSRAGVVRPAVENRLAQGLVEELAIKTPSLSTGIGTLSGGNQQKVLLGRSLLSEPRVLLADEPTQGVDAGARVEIYRILREVADSGRAVIVLSSDAIELAGLCDRVLVFSRGAVVKELAGEITEEGITEAAVTSTNLRTRVAGVLQAGGNLRRAAAGDYLPSLVLAVAVLALWAYTGGTNSRFFSGVNFTGMLFMTAGLAFVAFGQLLVLMTGGIDLSVGPLAGVLVAVTSFCMTDGLGVGGLALAILAMLGVGILVGTANVLLFRGTRMNPVVATLVTYTVLEGVGLLLRPEPAGTINQTISLDIQRNIWWIPIAFLVVVAVTLALELWLRRSRGGLAIRAVGSDEAVAQRLGVRPNRVYAAAYVGCSVFVVAGSLLLAVQVGIGDPSSGSDFTFQSITAIVLGGAAITGGRGSFVGALLGALLLESIISATAFLNLNGSWQDYLTGGLTIFAAAIYSRVRLKGVGSWSFLSHLRRTETA